MKQIQLYDYQQDMKERIERAFETFRSVMVQMPTGTGKTYLLASVVSEFLSCSKGKVWIVTHRMELVSQIQDTISKFSLAGDLRVRVLSIQWLSRHYRDLNDEPVLIVIDEAHHALADTYKELIVAHPKAKKLGLTATPCRLDRKGFTDLFDVLLQSWSVDRFIAEGHLSLYDYMSVKPDSEDVRMVSSLKKRGADGDYSIREMSEKLDVRPSIERLCDTVLRYAGCKKGIVYAIDIGHAGHIADCYRQNGINAVTISSKTKKNERCSIVEQFKAGHLDVLVNVDLFGEGFDCPDVEFIQLARPTLSLSRYLQQVGRGLRVFHGKKFCLILDNVGSYRLFGLPSDHRDWQAMFDGRTTGKAVVDVEEEALCQSMSASQEYYRITGTGHTEMITLLTHDGQRCLLDATFGYHVMTGIDGKQGVADKYGRETVPYTYNKVELFPYGFARLRSRRKADIERPWIDLVNGVRFDVRPKTVRAGFLEMSTSDGFRLYPRVHTRLMDEDSYTTAAMLRFGIGVGLRFNNYYVQSSEPTKLYIFKEKVYNMTLFADEQGRFFCKKDNEPEMRLVSPAEWETAKAGMDRRMEVFVGDVKRSREHGVFRQCPGWVVENKYCLGNYDELPGFKIMPDVVKGRFELVERCDGRVFRPMSDEWKYISAPAFGLRVGQKTNGKFQVRTDNGRCIPGFREEFDFAELLDGGFIHIVENGLEYWADIQNKWRYFSKPEFVKDGFLYLVRFDNIYIIRNVFSLSGIAFMKDELKTGNGICFLSGNRLILKSNLRTVFKVVRRYADNRHFDICSWNRTDGAEVLLYYDGVNEPKIMKRHAE